MEQRGRLARGIRAVLFAGLTQVLDLIRSRGMVPGMWLEPEVIGVDSEVAVSLPDAAFLRRDGSGSWCTAGITSTSAIPRHASTQTPHSRI